MLERNAGLFWPDRVGILATFGTLARLVSVVGFAAARNGSGWFDEPRYSRAAVLGSWQPPSSSC